MIHRTLSLLLLATLAACNGGAAPSSSVASDSGGFSPACNIGGTWYIGGDRTRAAALQQDGTSALVVYQGKNGAFIDSRSVLFPALGGVKASADATCQELAWSTGEKWTRTPDEPEPVSMYRSCVHSEEHYWDCLIAGKDPDHPEYSLLRTVVFKSFPTQPVKPREGAGVRQIYVCYDSDPFFQFHWATIDPNCNCGSPGACPTANIASSAGWLYTTQVSGTQPVYRVVLPGGGQTASTSLDEITSGGWTFNPFAEKILGYAPL